MLNDLVSSDFVLHFDLSNVLLLCPPALSDRGIYFVLLSCPLVVFFSCCPPGGLFHLAVVLMLLSCSPEYGAVVPRLGEQLSYIVIHS